MICTYKQSYVFNRKIAFLRDILIQTNVKLIHKSFNCVLKANIDSYKHKNVDILDTVMRKYSSIKVIDASLFVLCVVICTKTSNIEVADRKVPVLKNGHNIKLKQ